jgi:hypothetical protein
MRCLLEVFGHRRDGFAGAAATLPKLNLLSGFRSLLGSRSCHAIRREEGLCRVELDAREADEELLAPGREVRVHRQGEGRAAKKVGCIARAERRRAEAQRAGAAGTSECSMKP